MLRRLVGTTAPGHHDCSIQLVIMEKLVIMALYRSPLTVMIMGPIWADKDILDFVQSSKNIIDTGFNDENEVNNAAAVSTSSKMRNIMKSSYKTWISSDEALFYLSSTTVKQRYNIFHAKSVTKTPLFCKWQVGRQVLWYGW
ncbi:hypothetical protein TNCV_2141641 [Trichonephila clavipes]|uniref:Uncharacterized protein n=1 Tax=Trichonephila clavipes TaxID=2585209 RepID=A0A8X6V187_TRICX|nr:hypothetical protein TNCV_2141641 [Trichonephila clavipes]